MILNEWFQFTYLQYIFFKWFDSISFVFNFRKKYYLHLLYQKNLLQNFNLGTKIIFTYLKKINFYNFIYKNISIWFHLRRVIYTNYLKRHNFIYIRIFN